MLLFLDTETGGLRPGKHSLLQVGLAAYQDGQVMDRLTVDIRHPEYVVTGAALATNKIDLTQLDIYGMPESEAIFKITSFVLNLIDKYQLDELPTLVGHNVDFDRRFLMDLFDRHEYDFDNYFSYRTIDTAGIIRFLKEIGVLPKDFPANLHEAARVFGYEPKDEHTAQGDIDTTIFLLEKLMDLVRN